MSKAVSGRWSVVSREGVRRRAASRRLAAFASLAGFLLTGLAAVACTPTPPSPSAGPASALPPTAVASEEAAPSASPAGLTPEGPYILFAGQNSGVSIANADGSHPRRLTDQWLFGFDLHHALSPHGDRLAVVARDEDGYNLIEIHLPDGQARTLAQLISISRAEEAVLTSEPAKAAMMISMYDNIAWQPPDGRLIAVAAAADGPTSDVYLVDTISGEIRQLTDGPSQAINPSWSPDGEFIYHVGVSLVPPYGGAIFGFNRMDGEWAVNAIDGQVVAQPPLMHPSDFDGWFDERHYLMSDRDGKMAKVDVATGTPGAVLADFCSVYDAEQSGPGGTLVLSVLPEADCPSGSGVYLWDPATTDKPTLIDSERSWGMEWLEESDVFYVYPIALFSADGSRRSESPTLESSFKPAVSMAGYEAWEIIENTQGRVVVGPAGRLARDPAGGCLRAAMGPGHRRDPAHRGGGRHVVRRLGAGLRTAGHGRSRRKRRSGDLGTLDRPHGVPRSNTRSNSSR
jgi:hypothetical protein